MFQRIEARSYRCLRSIDQTIKPFEILVGPNASGKSTFLDVVSFLGDFVSWGLEAAVEQRTSNFYDLVWGRAENTFDLTIEAALPERRRPPGNWNSIRHEVRIRLDTSSEKLFVDKERTAVFRTGAENSGPGGETVFRDSKLRFSDEVLGLSYTRSAPGNYSALNSIPSDGDFPATTWLTEQLRNGIKLIALNDSVLRKPSPPAVKDADDSSGGYLARSISQLRNGDSNAARFKDWLSHLRTVLPDVKDVRTVLKEDDRHRYVVIDYDNEVSVPSWMLSGGTLRILALTILAYAPGFDGVYLIEEPENGLHPSALSAVYESLSSVYEGQVLVASHSPVLLSLAKPEEILCFMKRPNGTEIVRGSEHHALRDWNGEVSLDMLSASGILG